jgi:uncharacterized cupin superfamily protein
MGEIKIEHLSEAELEKRNIKKWDIWEKEPSDFNWSYTKEEHCYIIEGEAQIQTEDNQVKIKKGDYVVLPVGLTCTWRVKEKLKKFYNFM